MKVLKDLLPIAMIFGIGWGSSSRNNDSTVELNKVEAALQVIIKRTKHTMPKISRGVEAINSVQVVVEFVLFMVVKVLSDF